MKCGINVRHFSLCLLSMMLSIAAQSYEIRSLDKDSVLRRVDELKVSVDSKFWPTFNAPQYALEMHYYEDGPFRMHLVQNSIGGQPRMECSSPEVTFAAIPDVTTYEEWYAMLIHECFHGFVFKKHPQFWNKMLEATPQDFYASGSLKALKTNYPWYADMLTKENRLLSRMCEAGDITEVRQLWTEFLSIRNDRLRLVKERLGLDIELFYPITETNEGVARYIVYCLYNEQGLKDKTGWMTNLDSGSYYYTSGLYMILIMEKFNIDYRDDLFERYYTLTELLSDKFNNK